MLNEEFKLLFCSLNKSTDAAAGDGSQHLNFLSSAAAAAETDHKISLRIASIGMYGDIFRYLNKHNTQI